MKAKLSISDFKLDLKPVGNALSIDREGEFSKKNEYKGSINLLENPELDL